MLVAQPDREDYVEPSTALRVLYCVAIICATYPYGVLETMRGPMGLYQQPIAGPVLLFCVGLWRIYAVARHRGSLGYHAVGGLLGATRMIGIFAMTVSVAYLLGRWGADHIVGPFPQSGDGNTQVAVAYATATLFAFFNRFAVFGVVLFELSRQMGFEQLAGSDPRSS